jgi:hypothetical protein
MLSALLVLEVLLASAPANRGDPLQWRVPGQLSVVEVPGKMDVGGIPVRFRVITSKEKLEFLLQHFATAFDEAGFYIQRHQKRLAVQPHLTALDTRTLTSYTVILEPKPDGTTEVVVGEARLKDARPAAAPSGLPVFPGAKDVLHSNFEGARTLGYRVEAKEEQVKGWYREQLTRAGFQEEEPQLFRRKEQEVRLDVTQKDGGLHVFLFLRTAAEASSL